MTNLADCLKINRKQMFIVNAFLPEECVFMIIMSLHKKMVPPNICEHPRHKLDSTSRFSFIPC